MNHWAFVTAAYAVAKAGVIQLTENGGAGADLLIGSQGAT